MKILFLLFAKNKPLMHVCNMHKYFIQILRRYSINKKKGVGWSCMLFFPSWAVDICVGIFMCWKYYKVNSRNGPSLFNFAILCYFIVLLYTVRKRMSVTQGALLTIFQGGWFDVQVSNKYIYISPLDNAPNYIPSWVR